jgi:tetratricopeptide (TPR) repeat protein
MVCSRGKKNWPETDRLVCFSACMIIVVSAGAETSLDRVTRLNHLGANSYLAGRLDEAARSYRQALDEAAGISPSHLATVWSNLAAVYKRLEHFDDAAVAYEKVVELRRTAFGESSPDVAVALNNVADIKRIQGRTVEAARLLDQSAALLSKNAGSKSDLAAILNNLGAIRLEQRRYSEAYGLLTQALALKQSLYGANHREVAVTLNNLANVFQETGRPVEAERLLRGALQIWEADTTSVPDVSITLTNLGRLYTSLKRWDDAERMHRRALSVLSATGLSESRFAAAAWHNLALLYQRSRRPFEADDAFQHALDIRRAVFGPNHPLVIQAESDRRGLPATRSLTIDLLEFRSHR